MAEKKYEEVKGFDFWDPEENEELIGEVVEIKQSEKFGNAYVIKKDDGEKITTPSHKVLQNRMVDMKVGDNVKLIFEGEEAPSIKGNNPTKMYRVFKSA